jgi:hypothetical protein
MGKVVAAVRDKCVICGFVPYGVAVDSCAFAYRVLCVSSLPSPTSGPVGEHVELDPLKRIQQVLAGGVYGEERRGEEKL